MTKKSRTVPTSSMVGLIVFLLILATLSLRADIVNVSVPALVVVWPTPGTSLVERQTLMVSLQNVSQLETGQEVVWEVEDGVAGGPMTFDGRHYMAEVDTADWDWKKDNAYTLHFAIASVKDGERFARVSVPVYIGAVPTATTSDVADETIASAPTSSSLGSVAQSATVYQGGVVPKPVATQALPAPVSPLRVKWIPAPARNNQQFIYNVEGYAPEQIMAFWQAEGGHKNVLYETNSNGQYVVAINFFGWLWKGKGPYPISFVIADKEKAAEIARESFTLTWQGEPGQSEFLIESRGTAVATSVTTPTPTPPPQVPASAPLSSVPIVRPLTPSPSVGQMLFVAPKPAVENSLAALRDQQERTAINYILAQPNSVWLNGDEYETEGYISGLLSTAEAEAKLPAFVLYNIPQRDCGSYSSGGVASVEAYKAWIDRLANVFRNREAIILIEPDALPQLNCLADLGQREQRLEMLRYASEKLRSASPSLRLYIDAGHPLWVNAEEMADRLRKAGVASATGFSLNVSNFVATKDNITYGNYLSNLLGGKRYVIDTSRNGNGPSPQREWCNPFGRALGPEPVIFSANNGALDAYLWVKFPGESDGTCAGGPPAGGWWPDYAVDLFYN